jgi:hypothetical protein
MDVQLKLLFTFFIVFRKEKETHRESNPQTLDLPLIRFSVHLECCVIRTRERYIGLKLRLSVLMNGNKPTG